MRILSIAVSIHARTGRATTEKQPWHYPLAVSIHARTGRATAMKAERVGGGEMFQSTPARGGRLATEFKAVGRELFQSTPARGGRLPLCHCCHNFIHVSIHARTGRATRSGLLDVVWHRVSIHARTGRATWSKHCAYSKRWFQSTPARGGRRLLS